MKRTMALLLAMALLLTASMAAAEGELRGYTKDDGYVYVSLGYYPQTAEGGYLPILWRVLTVDEEKAYLCSEYVLFARPMHPDLTEYKTIGVDFGQTELCNYLNTEFSDTAFSGAELDLLIPLETYGKIFLLDKEDVKNKDIGMGTGNGPIQNGYNGLRAWGTDYAIANGLYRFQNKYGGHSPYWTRNQSATDKRHALCIKDGGQLGHIEVGRENEGVRPAVYLDLSKAVICGGTGTLEDPYTLALPEAEEIEE